MIELMKYREQWEHDRVDEVQGAMESMIEGSEYKFTGNHYYAIVLLVQCPQTLNNNICHYGNLTITN